MIEHEWSDATLHRVAAGLLKIAADFDLLTGTVAKQFASYHLQNAASSISFTQLAEREQSPGDAYSPAPDWQLFLMSAVDVEQELLRLHQYRKLRYEVAGSLMQLSLPCSSARDYAERMAA